MADMILVINAGSSSLKFEVFSVSKECALAREVKGQIDGIGTHPRLVANDSKGARLIDEHRAADEINDLPAALARAQIWLRDRFRGVTPIAVGHRVVHGGPNYAAPTMVDDAVLTQLEKLIPLAPLHQPNNLAPIRALRQEMPELAQVACFDTAFHHDQPLVAQRFALPRELHEAGIRRYGFHGLSYDYIASALRERAPDIASGRVIVAHLGAGASLCAMFDGKSVDTTMGFTALDGLPMGTRCGALDPGVILYLLRERGMDADRIEDLLYHRSGLLGVSALSSDMRELLSSNDHRAKEAVDLFVYRIAREVGALVATLGGLDALVFTAGIGEHAPEIRRRVCEKSGWLGIMLDPGANERGEQCISAAASRVSVWAIPTDEERMIARHTIELLRIEGAIRPSKAASATPRGVCREKQA